MTTWHFIPEKAHLINFFTDSPDVGDPECICSFCGEAIQDNDDPGEFPLRMFRERDNTEARLHMRCAKQVIYELAESESTQKFLSYFEG